MKTYEIKFKKDIQIKVIRCTKTGLEQTLKTIENDGGEIVEVNLRKKIHNSSKKK